MFHWTGFHARCPSWHNSSCNEKLLFAKKPRWPLHHIYHSKPRDRPSDLNWAALQSRVIISHHASCGCYFKTASCKCDHLLMQSVMLVSSQPDFLVEHQFAAVFCSFQLKVESNCMMSGASSMPTTHPNLKCNCPIYLLFFSYPLHFQKLKNEGYGF